MERDPIADIWNSVPNYSPRTSKASLAPATDALQSPSLAQLGPASNSPVGDRSYFNSTKLSFGPGRSSPFEHLRSTTADSSNSPGLTASPRSSVSASSTSSSPHSLGLSVALPACASPASSAAGPRSSGAPETLLSSQTQKLSPPDSYAALYSDTATAAFAAFSSNSSPYAPRPTGLPSAGLASPSQFAHANRAKLGLDMSSTAQPSSSTLSPTLSTPAAEPTQAALAEIFAGNPRPHLSSSYRSPARGPASALSPGLGPISPTSQPQEQQGRSYFSPPPPGTHRGRSQSSAPTFDQRPPIGTPAFAPTPQPIGGWNAPSTSQADQYGYRPSSTGMNGGHVSSSLPVAIGSGPRSTSISASSRRDESASPGRHAFGPASYSTQGAYDPNTGWRPSNAIHSSSFGWGDDYEREGRARLRPESDSAWSPAGGSSQPQQKQQQPIGIGASNMSPFTRGGDLRLVTDSPSGRNSDLLGLGPRDYSLGAVGSGRKRGESVWGSNRHTLHEDDEEDAPPTRSGATSRRHSFAAFEGGRRELGFHLAQDSSELSFNSTNSHSLWGNSLGMGSLNAGTRGSSAIQDDDLAADLNALQLNLEAHVAQSNANANRQPFVPATSNFSAPPKSATPGAGRPTPGRYDQPHEQNRTFIPSFGLPPPSPPGGGSFYPQGLSAQAPSFKAFTPATTAHPFLSQTQAYSHPGSGASSSPASNSIYTPPDLSNLGRGVPLHSVPSNAPLYIVEFKAGRKDLFFVEDPNLQLRQGDLVIVEADRGKDIGKFFRSCSMDEVQSFQQRLVEMALGQLAHPNNGNGGGGGGGGGGQPTASTLARMTREFAPKKIFAKAGPGDTHMLLAKAQDELKALSLIRNKVAQKGLQMEVCDAEWQWDRRKLTFYYVADSRVDFRELVRELFRTYKTRIWLCCLDVQAPAWNFG